jgi:hypothetical protein
VSFTGSPAFVTFPERVSSRMSPAFSSLDAFPTNDGSARAAGD